jgi:hypothetical protein
MGKLFGTQYVQPVVMVDDQGNEISPIEMKKYLLLTFANDESGNEIRNFDIILGRAKTVSFILNDISIEYSDLFNPFTSMVISDSVKIEEGISFYSFIRMCLENSMLSNDEWEEATLEGDDPFTLETWNTYTEELFAGYMLNMPGNSAKEKLDLFYKEDVTRGE